MLDKNNADYSTEEMPELELVAETSLEEEALLPSPVKKQSVLQRVRRAVAGLPKKITDPTQRKAGGNILKFLAIMLILTLIARGTAGATLAAVDVANPGSAEIISAVTGSGTVAASGRYVEELPDNLTLREILVTPGQKVKEGDPLAHMDASEIDNRLAREEATLKGLEHELKVLNQAPIADNSNLVAAQRNLNRAQQALTDARNEANRQIAEAQAALDNANAALQQAMDAQAALPPTATPDEQAAAASAVQSAQQAVNEAATALEQAKSAGAKNILAAEQAVEDAQTSLDSAKTAQAQNQRDAQNQRQENAIKAEKLKLDIKEQKELIETLQKVQEADYHLLAAHNGTVVEASAEGSKTTGGAVVTIADTSGGFEAKVPVSKVDAQKLNPGDTAEVVVESGSMYGNPMVNATVIAIGEPGEDGQCTVTLRLPNSDWKQGQVVQARIVQNKQSYSMCVPVNALRNDTNGYFVLITETQKGILGSENVVVKVPVTLKAKDQNNAAIEGPLSPDSKVIVSSTRPLEEGDRVRVDT